MIAAGLEQGHLPALTTPRARAGVLVVPLFKDLGESRLPTYSRDLIVEHGGPTRQQLEWARSILG
jgi:hypothetical protein